MDKLDRIQQLHRLFSSRRYPVSLATIAEKLECSQRQARRLIDTLRDETRAPLVYDRARKGWWYAGSDEVQLPGLWFTGEELRSLGLFLELSKKLGNQLLSVELEPIRKCLYGLLKARGIEPAIFEDKVRILPIGNRQSGSEILTSVSQGLLQNQRLQTQYRDYQGKLTNRSISPQHLVYYRDNWYLDAWCHLRNDLRTFSVARIVTVEVLKQPAIRVETELLEKQLASSYGIFSGEGTHKAILRFLPAVAREVSTQYWHPGQQGQWDGDDYLLTFPYSEDKELVLDLLRYTPHVYVEGPAKLRKALQARLQQGLELCLGGGLGRL